MSLGLDPTPIGRSTGPGDLTTRDADEDGRFQVATVGAAIPFPAQAGPTLLRLALPELATGALASVGAVAALAAPLAGDTPQPIKHAYDGLNLYVSADHRQAWFTRDAGAALTLGPVQFLPHEQALNVPVRVEDGGVSFDQGALERAYGHALPAELVKQARSDISERDRISPTGSRALSTRSSAARAVAQNPQQLQNWQAHHLIPYNVVNDPALSPIFLKAAQAGWRLDSAQNLIALPADENTYLGPPNNRVLPEHNGSHRIYNQQVRNQLATSVSVTDSPITIKSEVEDVEHKMQDLILGR